MKKDVLENKVKILANRMLGEVYPELLALMRELGMGSVEIEFLNNSIVIIGSDRKMKIRTEFEVTEPKAVDIYECDTCPIYLVMSNVHEMGYIEYCDKVLHTIDEMRNDLSRLDCLMRKIDMIPTRRLMLTEKTMDKTYEELASD